MSLAVDPVVAASREMIRAGSKSFAGAARLLPTEMRESVYQLYAWCRYCDDVIDLQDLGRGAPTDRVSEAGDRLRRLRLETRRALEGETIDEPVFVALQRVVQRHDIPHHHPFELLEGFAMDVDERQYHTLDDLLAYCYHVAGVVGVMMAYVMGAEGEDTLDRAADLGIALQLTNIARDVMDDASAGRIYLPREWLTEAGVPADEILERRHRGAVHGVVRRMLAEADQYYRSASVGVARLPLRAAWSIATARGVYRDIGSLVLRQGETAWDERVVVSKPRKLVRAAGAGVETFVLAALRPQGERYSREGLWTRPRPGTRS